MEKERRRLEYQAQNENQSPGEGSEKKQADLPFPVRVSGNIVIVDGTEEPVQPHLASWLELLLEARETGEKVKGEQFLAVAGRGKNVSREFKTLFAKVPRLAELIGSRDGAGGGWYFTR